MTYEYSQKTQFIEDVIKSKLDLSTKHKEHPQRHYFKVYNTPCVFDIKTSSFKDKKKRLSAMYVWTFGINDIYIYGRTWEELNDLLSDVVKALDVSPEKRLICYTQSLGEKFQFMQHYFDWDPNEMFAISNRSPLYAMTTSGIEFRCFYALTGLKLDEVELTEHEAIECSKADYKPRHYLTELSKAEINSYINDIRKITYKISECINEEYHQNIAFIPNTKTGYPRRDFRKAIMKNTTIKKKIQGLKLTLPIYTSLKKANSGGRCVYSTKHAKRLMENVTSLDLSSSYPSQMLAEKYPMSNAKEVMPESEEEFYKYLEDYCCLIDIKLENVKLRKGMPCCIIPDSEHNGLFGGRKVIENNNIKECDVIYTTLTELDFKDYSKFYKFDYQIINMYIFKKEYLPKPIIELVLQYYNSKTKLKGIKGSESLYQRDKSKLNAIAGMMITDIVREQYKYYNNAWVTYKPIAEDDIEKYNEKKDRFNWYPWGVWISAYGRHSLISAIYECGDNFIYSDTDSVKLTDFYECKPYFDYYNEIIKWKMERCLEHYNIDKSFLIPKNAKGDEKPLGIWDFEGEYKYFKALGQKTYMCETQDGIIETTIAGASKKASEFFQKLDDPFEYFDDDFNIPAEYSGKVTCILNDDEHTFIATDYKGKFAKITSKSGLYKEPSAFSMSVDDHFAFGLLMSEVVARINVY